MENIWLEPVVDAWKTYFGSKSAKIVVDVGTRDGDDAELKAENESQARYCS